VEQSLNGNMNFSEIRVWLTGVCNTRPSVVSRILAKLISEDSGQGQKKVFNVSCSRNCLQKHSMYMLAWLVAHVLVQVKTYRKISVWRFTLCTMAWLIAHVLVYVMTYHIDSAPVYSNAN